MNDNDPPLEFGSPFKALIDHCESGDLCFRTVYEHKAIFFSVQGQAAIFDVMWLITHDDEVFEINVKIPVSAVDEKMRPLVSEFVNRANHGMALGHFDLGVDDGKLHFHLGHVIGEGGLADELIGRLMATALDTADKYFPALMRVMFGGHTPGDAIYLSEIDLHAEAEPNEVDNQPDIPASRTAPSPSKKKRRRARKVDRSKAERELPGLFEEDGGR